MAALPTLLRSRRTQPAAFADEIGGIAEASGHAEIATGGVAEAADCTEIAIGGVAEAADCTEIVTGGVAEAAGGVANGAVGGENPAFYGRGKLLRTRSLPRPFGKTES